MIRALAVVCITAACAAVPTAAVAKPAKQPTTKQAEFKAVLKGSQVTEWTYNRPYDENNPCVSAAQGYGDSSIYFGSNQPLKLKFVAPPKDQPNLFSSRGRPVVVSDPSPYRLDVTAARDTDVNYEQPGPKCDGPNGGGVDPEKRPKDCGERTGTIAARFFFDQRSVLDDAIPTDYTKRNKNTLRLETSDPAYQGSEDGSLEYAYENCHLDNLSSVEHQGTTYTVGGKLIEKQLFNKKRKTFRVSGSYITPVQGDFYNGKTILAWNLKLTRIK
jgi:hypothetical protein